MKLWRRRQGRQRSARVEGVFHAEIGCGPALLNSHAVVRFWCHLHERLECSSPQSRSDQEEQNSGKRFFSGQELTPNERPAMNAAASSESVAQQMLLMQFRVYGPFFPERHSRHVANLEKKKRRSDHSPSCRSSTGSCSPTSPPPSFERSRTSPGWKCATRPRKSSRRPAAWCSSSRPTVGEEFLLTAGGPTETRAGDTVRPARAKVAPAAKPTKPDE